MKRLALYSAGMLTAMIALGTPLLAQTQVPEIDGGSLSTGIGLLTGGLLILRARWRSR